MAAHIPGPRRARQALDDDEREVARTADLVLHLTSLAERYDSRSGSAERVALLRATASVARRALVQLAAEPLAVRRVWT